MIKINIVHFDNKLHADDQLRLLSRLGELERQLLPIRKSKRYNDSLLAIFLTKEILSKELQIPETDITFCKTELGKPFVKIPGIVPPDISISHSNNCLVVAVGFNDIVGIDVEEVRSFEAESLDSFFSESERLFINTGVKTERIKRFFIAWTSIESYLKMIGKGFLFKKPNLNFSRQNKNDDSIIIINQEGFKAAVIKSIIVDNYIVSVACTKEESIKNANINQLILSEIMNYEKES